MIRRMLRALGWMVRDRRGSVSPMLVLMLIPMIGALGMGVEGSSWFFARRSMQNAADSAALAAAINGCDATIASCVSAGSPYFDVEAKAVAAKYGFKHNVDDTTVVVQNKVACPAPSTATNCFKVTITRKSPIYLTRLVGFNGNTTTSGGVAATLIQAASIASANSSPNSYCLLSLASGGPNVDGIRCNGCSAADMGDCSVGTNGKAVCNGGNLGAAVSDAAGATSSCAETSAGNHTGVTQIPDPYAYLAPSIPANTCPNPTAKGTYTQGSGANPLSGALVLTSTPTVYCGDVNLTGNLNVTTPAGGSVIVIENGKLNIPSGMTLKTLTGSGLTIIFSGPTISGFSPSHILSGGGTIDIAAPTSGTWSGVAIYQDPALTSGVDFSAAGNSPTWNITGLIYLPKADVTFSGIVNKASNGRDCFALVVDTFKSNGTTTIFEQQTQCASAGLVPPSGGSAITRTSLLQ